MKKKTYVQLTLLFLLFNYFIVINAVAVDYSLDIDKDSNWIWRVDEYDEETYKDIFITLMILATKPMTKNLKLYIKIQKTKPMTS